MASLREIQPGIFAKEQPGHAIAGPGRQHGIREESQMMLAAMMMDIGLEAPATTSIAYADVSARIRAAPFLIECVLLMRAEPQIGAPVIQLIAIDMIHFAIMGLGEEQAMHDHCLAIHVRRRVPTLAMMPGMATDHGQIYFVK